MVATINQTDRAEAMAQAIDRAKQWRQMQELGLVVKHGDFFPSVHYPPITMYAPITEEKMFEGYTMPADGLLDVYLHIPFCEKQCVFCHYPVKLGQQLDEKDRYLAAMEKEMDLYLRRLGLDRVKARSVLVGGGTPTYLTLPQMRRFLEGVRQRIEIGESVQFNYDVDPQTLVGPEGRDRLQLMREYGVNRLTIGVQSLRDDILKRMGRHHDAATAVECIQNSLEFGYQVNIEFIFGYPGQTLENWMDVIEEAVSYNVHEIQLYRLKVESYGDHQGAIKNYRRIKPEEVPSSEEAIMMKQLAISLLGQNGYHENLRRVYSRERDHYSHYAHNQCCALLDQIGIGLTAFSSLRDRFILNTCSFEEYYRSIETDRLPLNRGIVRSKDEQMRWAVVLPIKNRDIWKELYVERTGRSINEVFRPKIDNLKSFGLVEESDEVLGVTRDGAFYADEVAQQFQSARFMQYPRRDYAEGPLNPFVNADP